MVARRAGRMFASLVFATAFLLTVPVNTAYAQDQGITQTPFGPLTAADRDLLVKVRQAGLWEGPAGGKAAEKGGNARVREIGPIISNQHADLDKYVRSVARQLNVPLPNEPSADNKKWLGEMDAAAAGPQFDQVFVDRMRAAHGKVHPVVSQNLAGTRNAAVREFARHAAVVVSGHMQMLESTGLVDFNKLPMAPDPSAASQSNTAVAQSSANSGWGPMNGFIVALLFVVGVIGTVGLLRVLRS
jgi:predicted outer membrane protein